MEFLIYICMLMFALGICGVLSDFVLKNILKKKQTKKVLVHVYAGPDRYISYYAKKCAVDKQKTPVSARKCA